ncbi:large ribosomal subunit protein uL24m [Atheta coriaria]|uniref:large ribosomal subunit protein uL24m n=1 Tax=Dalotia coriaria TaxID=877792 RepID=UPI0031F43516
MRLTNLLLQRVGKWSKQYANLPDRYIERTMNQVYWRNPKGIQYKPDAEIKRKKFKFGLHRPWTFAFRQDNQPGRYSSKIFIEPVKEWSFFRGDRVEILVGKDKGKHGYVREIIQERNWVIVEGLNTKLKSLAEDKNFAGVFIQTEQPLLVTTEVALVDPSDLKSTPIEWRYTEEGEKVRVSLRSGRIIPVPASMEETIDYKSKKSYKEQAKDTLADDASAITFQPALKTFEMDILESMGVKAEGTPPKTYWY